MNKTDKYYNGVDRLELLGYELLSLISQGNKENVKDIQDHLQENNIIEYLREKYPNCMNNTLSITARYNYEDWNKALGQFQTTNNCHIVNDEDGLLLLLALVLQLVADREENPSGIVEQKII